MDSTGEDSKFVLNNKIMCRRAQQTLAVCVGGCCVRENRKRENLLLVLTLFKTAAAFLRTDNTCIREIHFLDDTSKIKIKITNLDCRAHKDFFPGCLILPTNSYIQNLAMTCTLTQHKRAYFKKGFQLWIPDSCWESSK